MEEFRFCLEIIKREIEKFNLTVNSTIASSITAATAENINYDIAINRCSYLYRCGTINLCFAKDCFTKFFSDYKSLVFLLSKWISHPNLTVCSLSNGPALDYIAFLLSYQECGMFPSLFKDIKVVSKHGAWRNTVNIMHQIVTEGNLKRLPNPVTLGNIEVIQGDPFKDFTQKVESPISSSDVLIMVKKLNLQADLCNLDIITKPIKEFLAALKPDAILFCIDTKPSIALITKEISSLNGTYLLQPTFMNTSITLELMDFYKDIFGCFPVISARGSFFVWQKSSISIPSSHLDNLMDEVSESVKRLIKINVDNSYCDKSFENNYDKKVTGSSSSSPTYFSSNFAERCNEVFMSNENFKSLPKESENKDVLCLDLANISVPNSRKFSTSSSLQNNFITCENAENVLTKEMSSKCISVNKSTQTEPVISFKSTESVKMAALTERVVNLTAAVNNMLQTSEIRDECTHDNSLKPTEGMHDGSVNCSCIPSYSSSMVSCSHKYHFGSPENFICSCSQEKNFGNFSANHVHKQGCLICSQSNSSISLDSDCETTKHNKTPCKKLKISAEKKSVPKLVIPLSNLSGDAIAQIVSLISQSNSEFEKL